MCVLAKSQTDTRGCELRVNDERRRLAARLARLAEEDWLNGRRGWRCKQRGARRSTVIMRAVVFVVLRLGCKTQSGDHNVASMTKPRPLGATVIHICDNFSCEILSHVSHMNGSCLASCTKNVPQARFFMKQNVPQTRLIKQNALQARIF